MIYLDSFSLPSRNTEEDFFDVRSPIFKMKNHRTCYTTKYPFGVFLDRTVPAFDMSDITILYGNNGSGKSTILNLIAEKLSLPRSSPYNRSDFFDDFVELCSYRAGNIPEGSRIIASDEVFEKLLDIRRLNEGIDRRRDELIREYVEEMRDASSGVANAFTGLDDYERWKRSADIRKRSTTQSSFIRANLAGNLPERSNGESALALFVETIPDGALCLLDEPENSLSPANQLQLKYYIEDCVRNYRCQFVISTHSPFLLSLRHAKVYDLDAEQVAVRPWEELESIKVYREFFKNI